MAAIELATGYITLTAEVRNVAKSVGRSLTGVESEGTKAGKNMGAAMAKGFEKSKPDVDALRKDVEVAEKKIVAATERSAAKQADAKRKVEIAQAKLNEAQKKYEAGSSQVLTATDKLATAQQRLEAETKGAASEQDKLQRELTDSKKKLNEAEKATNEMANSSKSAGNKFTQGFKGIGAKVKNFMTKGVKDGGKAAEKEAKKAGKKSGGGFSTAFKGALAGLAAGVSISGIVQGIGGSIQAAGDLEQSVGAIDSVFKDSAGQMHKWSQTAYKDVGLTKNEFNELGTLMGAQLKNGGTAMDQLAPKTGELINLGSDLSSMFGGTTREAVEALSSALKGERDPIERYGVSLKQSAIDAKAAALGFKKVGGSFDNNAQQAATLALIMEQTTDAHGNFARESDTFAHKQQVMQARWKDLTTSMGELFMPALTAVFGFIGDKAIPLIEGFVGKLGDVAKGFGAIWSLVVDGDFNASVREAFGWEEDHPMVDFLLNVHDGISGLIDLIFKGDFSGKLHRAFGWEEDHPFVNFILDVRDGVGGLFDLIFKGDYNGKLRQVFGWEEDHPFVNFIFDVRDGIAELFQKVKDWFVESADAIPAAIAGTVSVVGAFLTWKTILTIIGLVRGALVGLWGVMMANPVGLIVGIIALLVGAFILAYQKVDWFRDFVDKAWAAIKDAIVFAWEKWIQPALKALGDFIVNVLIPAVVWFWQNVIIPAWNGISGAIKWSWEFIILPIFKAIDWFISTILAPVFKWLYENIIRPAWEGISAAVQIAGGILDTVFRAINWFIKNILGPVFDWFYTNVIKPVFEGVSKVIEEVWKKNIEPVFRELGNFIRDNVAPAFEKGVDAIAAAWNMIQRIAAAPVNFVIETVYNKGLRVALNKVREIVGGDPLPEVAKITVPPLGNKASKGVASKGGPMRAFAKGGQMPYGWKLVGEEGPELIHTGPGFVYTADQTTRMLNAQDQAPLGALNALNGGRSPKSALPIGGPLDEFGNFVRDTGTNVGNALGAAGQWVRGGLADAASLLLSPIKSLIGSTVNSDTVLGDIVKRTATGAIDGAIDWIRGKDEESFGGGAGGAFGYDGPLGSFVQPLRGAITSLFGSSRGKYPHAGIDFAARIGTVVRAAWDGIIRSQGTNVIAGRTGKGVVMGHGNNMGSYYGHLSQFLKGPGTRVKAGEPIALSGNTGRSTGPHLHWETWVGGRPVNPLGLLRSGSTTTPRAGAPRLYDSGGWLPQGVSYVENRTGKPEAILSPEKWDIAERSLQQTTTSKKTINFNGPIGYDPEEILRRMRIEEKRELLTMGV